MVDYLLTSGAATSVRQSDSLEEGYVDVDMIEVDDVYASVEATDKLLVQRGAAVVRTATVTVLQAGLQVSITANEVAIAAIEADLEDVDRLNRAYLY
jgi:hypothetical protein